MTRKILCMVFFLSLPAYALAADTAPPFYEQVMKVMEPLEYSGVPVMVKPQVSLEIDFGRRTWTLRNVHEYDGQGGIILEQGRYGLCAELATYLYEHIIGLFNARYVIKFAMVNEEGYFGSAPSNHIVLIMVDRADNQVYLMDPSFHRYALKKQMPEYHVLNITDSLSFVKERSHDVSFSVDQATPLYIKKDFLLTFSVTSVDGKFDRDNFILVIAANQRGEPSGHDIVLIGRRNKELVDFENKAVLTRLLSEGEINVLFGKIKNWMEAVRL